MSLLGLMIWAPIAAGFAALLLKDPDVVRRWALAASLFVFVLAVVAALGFDPAGGYQWQYRTPWIPAFNINYHLGVDGLSLPLVVLTAFIGILAILTGWNTATRHIGQFFAAFLMLEGLLIGVFCAMDAALFYIFFEAMLIPMFLIIGVWGSDNRVYAAVKFFLYTFLGSVLMLVAFVYLAIQSGSFQITDWHTFSLSSLEQTWLFLALLLGFAVKVPMWPVHTWLPDAHVEAPAAGSVVLAAVLLKIGGYGLLRFCLPIAPDASLALDGLVIGLSLIAVVYIGFTALAQTDMKKLIAYSSIAHMGFVTLGLFILYRLATETAMLSVSGAIMQMISHGLVSAALFVCVGVLYDRRHSRDIQDYGGVLETMPIFGALFVFFALANAGLPGTSGFVGEVMVILATFQAGWWLAALAAMVVVLGAAYSLWMVRRVVFGPAEHAEVKAFQDLSGREMLILLALAVPVLAVGLWPVPLLDLIEPSVAQLIDQAQTFKAGGAP